MGLVGESFPIIAGGEWKYEKQLLGGVDHQAAHGVGSKLIGNKLHFMCFFQSGAMGCSLMDCIKFKTVFFFWERSGKLSV